MGGSGLCNTAAQVGLPERTAGAVDAMHRLLEQHEGPESMTGKHASRNGAMSKGRSGVLSAPDPKGCAWGAVVDPVLG